MEDIRSGVCPLCAHNEVIEGQPHDDAEHGIYRIAVARGRSSWLGLERGDDPRGALLVYVCRRCGKAEWFAERPADIPVDEELGTRLITGPKMGPFR